MFFRAGPRWPGSQDPPRLPMRILDSEPKHRAACQFPHWRGSGRGDSSGPRKPQHVWRSEREFRGGGGRGRSRRQAGRASPAPARKRRVAAAGCWRTVEPRSGRQGACAHRPSDMHLRKRSTATESRWKDGCGLRGTPQEGYRALKAVPKMSPVSWEGQDNGVPGAPWAPAGSHGLTAHLDTQGSSNGSTGSVLGRDPLSHVTPGWAGSAHSWGFGLPGPHPPSLQSPGAQTAARGRSLPRHLQLSLLGSPVQGRPPSPGERLAAGRSLAVTSRERGNELGLRGQSLRPHRWLVSATDSERDRGAGGP